MRASGSLGAAAALAACVVLAGCSNLSSRPEWAYGPTLPADHPLALSYPSATYVTVVVSGVGPTIEAARDAARRAGHAKLTDPLVAATRAGSSTGAAGERHQALVEARARALASEALAFVTEVAGWDGYDGDEQYRFACFGLDKGALFQRYMQRVRETYEGLVAAIDQVEGAASQDAAERLALEGLERLLELKLLRAMLLHVGADSALIEEFWRKEDLGAKEVAFAGVVHAAGDRREQRGGEGDLREAVKFYERALELRPDPLLAAGLERARSRLPCALCREQVSETREAHARLQELSAPLEDPGAALAERGRVGIAAVQAITRYRDLREHGCRYYRERTRELPAYDALDLQAVQAVRAYASELERSEDERALEECASLYAALVAHRPGGGDEGRLLEVRRRLPCLECGRAKRCPQCRGERGELVTCRECNGAERLTVRCPVCRGDGLAPCAACGARGSVDARCPAGCDARGEVVCEACGGRGKRGGETCADCGGAGEKLKLCPLCPAGKPRPTCPTCKGRGSTSKRCRDCDGRGRAPEWPCFRCTRGRVDCGRCRGTTVVAVSCRPCGGRGRTGTCQRCRGDRKVVVACTACKDGKSWQDCARCGATGLCATCGGRGHRVGRR